jgi:hypothetical protein
LRMKRNIIIPTRAFCNASFYITIELQG